MNKTAQGTGSFELYEQLCNLKYDYARALDDRNWVQMRNCFTSDAEFEVPSTGPISGADNAVEEIRGRFRDQFAFTLHECIMPQFTPVSPTEVEGVWEIHTLTITHEAMKQPVPTQIHGYGRYHETYRKVGDDWKIAKLRLVRRFKDDPELKP